MTHIGTVCGTCKEDLSLDRRQDRLTALALSVSIAGSFHPRTSAGRPNGADRSVSCCGLEGKKGARGT